MRITLSQGQSISIALTSDEFDCYLRVRDAGGNLLYENDDSGGSLNSRVAFTAPASGTYYIDVGSYDDAEAGGYQLAVDNYTPPPVGTIDQFADFLASGYWGGDPHHFDVGQGDSLTVNLAALTAEGRTYAREALNLWSDVIGVQFVEVASGGQITFGDNEEGAFSEASWWGGITQSAYVNVSTAWLNDYRGDGLDSYAFLTYVHEIGHALGLGHAGDYNFVASYPYDAVYQNDGWPVSVMSYFDQIDSTYFADRDFSQVHVVTPMIADVLAMSQLYGLSTTTRTGNTVYGFNSTAGRDVFNASLYPNVAYTIVDSGGTDTLDYSGFGAVQRIDLNPETFFNIGGLTGNVAIARGTVIENAIGGAGNDELIGNGVANWLEGGPGNDIINGGGGHDTARYSNASSAVTVNLGLAGAQNTGGAGVDTLTSIENLFGSTYSDTLTGNSGDNFLNGGSGADRLYGNGGNDTLDGGSGEDKSYGGLGDDTFIVDSTGDATVEVAGEGTDLVQSSLSHGLKANIENLTLTGATALNGTGNELSNVLTGNNAANRLDGLGGDDQLIGNGGDDTLDGGLGDDTMAGGLGNDSYVIDSDGDDTVENAGEGTDNVKASVSHTLQANLENLTLTGAALNGTGNALANILNGNELANILAGAVGADRMFGNAGNDTLDGGSGEDKLYGGAGNDVYVVDSSGDATVELAGEGTDLVEASVTHTLKANVENLILTGSLSTFGTGNALANTITGNAGANRLEGLDGDDTLTGNAGLDRLYGGNGSDALDGGSGEDKLYGGAGDDTFIVDSSGDATIEYLNEGIDLVEASISHTLKGNIEDLTLIGVADLNGTGNALDNRIDGSSGDNVLSGLGGADTLDGGAGRDSLYGGTGADIFAFDETGFAGLTSATCDVIGDFSQAEGDTIRLSDVDADSGLAGDQGFAFIGGAAFSNTAGELRFEQIDGNTYVQGDTNGDGLADFMIRLDGLHALPSSDYVL